MNQVTIIPSEFHSLRWDFFCFLSDTSPEQVCNLRKSGGGHMTTDQKEQIRAMRLQGLGYGKIAQALGISSNTVRSFCRRNSLCGDTTKNSFCKQCGKAIKIIPKQKPRKFCSDICRTTWWNSHLNCVNRKAVYHFTCACCGQAFTAYGDQNRKYCSHSCYITDRFGRERGNHE